MQDGRGQCFSSDPLQGGEDMGVRRGVRRLSGLPASALGARLRRLP